MAGISQEFEVNLMEYVWIIWRKKWLIIGLFLLAIISSYFYANSLTPIYQTSAIIMVEDNRGVEKLFNGDMFEVVGDKKNTYSRMLKTWSFLEQVVREMDLRDSSGKLVSANVLRSRLSVSILSGTDLLEISYQDPNPERAVMIVNALIKVFQQKNLEMNKSSMTGARKFIEKQKEIVEKELRKVEEDLLAYKKVHNVNVPNEETRQLISRFIEIEELKAKADIELKSVERSIHRVEQELALQSKEIISSISIRLNPLIESYKRQLTQLESKLAGLESMYSAHHPEILSLQSQIEKIEEALYQEVTEEVSEQSKTINPTYQAMYRDLIDLEVARLAWQAKITGYSTLLTEYESDLRKLPSQELEITRLEREMNVSTEIYTMLFTKAEEIKISESMLTSDIYLVDPAYLPRGPIKPNKKIMYIMAGFLAIAIGVILTILLEFFDSTVKSGDEIEKMLGLPVLGSIPDMHKLKKYYK